MSSAIIAIEISSEVLKLSEEQVFEKLQCLGSKVMRWADRVYLVDLTNELLLWQRVARERQLALSALWRSILLEQFALPSDLLVRPPPFLTAHNVIALNPAFCAAVAPHPWKALLLLAAMREREIFGLVNFYSSYGAQLYNAISWSGWWTCFDRLRGIMGNTGFAQRASIRQFQAAMQKLNLDRPASAHMLSSNGIRRRYGKLLAEAWSWAFGEEGTVADVGIQFRVGGESGGPPHRARASEHGGGDFRQDPHETEWIASTPFPWRTWKLSCLPQIHRNLNDPLTLWSQLTSLLIEDLDFLSSELHQNPGQRLTRLVWRLTLEDLELIEMGVSFRHPHDLQKEKGAHLTILSQLESRFYKVSEKQFSKDQRVGESSAFYPIMAWDLEIAEAITLPATSFDLLGDMEEAQQESTLLLLSNQLADQPGIGFNRFEMLSDFWPEDSFRGYLGTTEKNSANLGSREKQDEVSSTQQMISIGDDRSVSSISTKFSAQTMLSVRPIRRDEEATECCERTWLPQLPALMASAKARPLYILKEPKLMANREHELSATTNKELSEIVLPKWWQTLDADQTLESGRRRYYKLVTARGETLWAFQDAGGRWFWHGVFG